ncbi:MAG: ABC transporter ATP-binding protein [Kiritimatiellia bacterium]
MSATTSENRKTTEGQALSLRMTLRIFAILGPYAWWILFATLMVCVSAWADMQVIHVASRLFESQSWQATGILRAIAPIAALALVNRLFGWVQLLISVYAGNRAMASLRKRFFDRLMILSKSFFDRHKAGWLVARSTGDMSILQDFATYALMMLGVFGTITISALIRISHIAPLLLVPAAIMMPLVIFMTARYKKRMTTLQRTARDQNSRLVANMAETVRGVRVVHAFSRQDRNLEDFNAINASSHDTEVQIAKMDGLFMPALDFLSVLNLILVVLFATWILHDPRLQTLAQRINIADVIAYILYMNMLIWPMRMIVELYGMALRAMSAAERIFEIIDMQPDVTDPEHPSAITQINGAIDFCNVSFRYNPEGEWIIKDLDLSIRPGETIALAGATGAGKTTILSLAARFFDPQQGSVQLDETNIRDFAQDDLHQHMGIVLQQGYLFSGTVMENLKFRRTDLEDAFVIEQARRLGTHDTIMALSDGYQTFIQEGGESLSLGQRQIIAITRALLANPEILLLDEPTSSLDVYTESIIQQAIHEVMKGRTSLVIAHRLSTIQKADRILVIDDGRIVEQGTHAELMQHEGPYRRLILRGNLAEHHE